MTAPPRLTFAAWCLAAALFAALPARAQDAAFAVTPETAAFADGAPAVVRLYETEYDVASPGRATTRVRLVTTAFGPAGREAAGALRLVHGGFRDLRRVEGTLRDADGRVVGTAGGRDGEDRALTSLYEDLRLRSVELYGDRYPFTVEWAYEIEHRGVLGWPTWRPQPEGRPVESAAFWLEVPSEALVRTWTRDLGEGVRVRSGGRDRYAWGLADRPAAEAEPFGPPWWDQLPELRLGTDRFEIGDAPGRLDSWDAFGAWYGGLSQDRQALPEAARAAVHQIIEGAATDREKARRLYRHLQQTTRYVSVQLGLGGWQPFDAAYVFERRYGDCKALTNYMQALLAEAGIASDPVLVEAGEHGSALAEDFPDNAFNHVVLRVALPDEAELPMRTAPIRTGAAWLECTSPYAAFDHLGAFTEGRPALRVTDTGGELVQTPVSAPDANRTLRTATVRLDERGGAEADVAWALRGEPRADALAAFDRTTSAEHAGVLREVTGLPSLDVLDFDLSGAAERPDEITIGARLRIAHAARRAGGRLLVSLVPFAGAAPALPRVDARTQPVWLGSASAERDTVRFVLPEGYAVHRLPEPVQIVSPAGRYRLEAETADDGALVVVRELVVETPRLPAEAYDEARTFFAAVARADAEQAVLRTER
ncbi:DUF3857 domain-containing protein [Rubrivirga litoralis]|uniref:DUF3857 domain-containing protein n=1 Tax=Rubrivirga litoralis TaxID=3075598 RepID=A0ABU3BR11_9BACT|nr:DUF3857 domain-containing protein [Rubrivirga sp. F394]MDT0631720.1 DUF3857 domain-containing protein [Rubrivirga sp. F394]